MRILALLLACFVCVPRAVAGGYWGGGGSVTVPGSNTQVIFNDSGALGADSGLVFNKTTNALTILGPLITGTRADIVGGGTGYGDGQINVFSGASADLSIPFGTGLGVAAAGNDLYVGFRNIVSSSTGAEFPYYALNKSRGSYSSPAASQSGDVIGSIGWEGYESSRTTAGAIIVTQTGSNSSGVSPSKIELQTGTSGSLSTRLNIASDGAISIPNGTASVVPLTIQGASSQSANLQNWKDSSSNVLASVSSAGVIAAPNLTVSKNVNTTPVGNVGAGEDDLISSSLTAATLANSGDCAEITAFGTFAANANLKQVKLKFGATTVFATGAAALNGGSWHISAKVVRTGASTQIASATFNGNVTVVTADATYSEPAETLSGAVTIKCTGEATADNDIIQKGLMVRYLPNL